VFIEPELASNIMPTEVRSGLSLASVTAELEVKDNVYTIKVIFNMRKNINFTIKINFAALFLLNYNFIKLGFTYIYRDILFLCVLNLSEYVIHRV